MPQLRGNEPILGLNSRDNKRKGKDLRIHYSESLQIFVMYIIRDNRGRFTRGT
jgi:hypothetical protein